MSDKRTHPGLGHAHPATVAATNQAGKIDHLNTKANLNKPPLPKRAFQEAHAPEIHSGMLGKSRRTGQHFAGVSGTDLSRFDANPGDDPTAALPRGKVLTPVQPVPGQRSRANDPLHGGAPGEAHAAHQRNADQFTRGLRDLSTGILDDAGNHSAVDDRRALGIGDLPQQVRED